MAAREPESLEYIVNHIILPPKLPQIAEHPDVFRTVERDIVQLLSTQLKSYCCKIVGESSNAYTAWAINQAMLDCCAILISTPSLDLEMVTRAFASLDGSGKYYDTMPHMHVLNRLIGKPAVLPIHIRAQNAVLIIRKGNKSVIFECFEASPSAEAVITSDGALTRRFPAHAVSIPLEVFEDQKFRGELVDKICKLDVEQIEEMIPKCQTAGRSMVQIKDTASPRLVTEMLMAILASLGTPVNVQQIQKRTRDDALLENCTQLPWRRSSFWLALRVTIQSSLGRMLPHTQATVEYKNFMIFLLAEIASEALTAALPEEICHVIAAKIARRAFKLGSYMLNFVRDRALKVCGVLDVEMKRKWKIICDEDGNRPTTIERDDFERDTALSLDNIKGHIDAILGNEDTAQVQLPFEPGYQPWLQFALGLPSLDVLPSAHEETIYVLAEFEYWIANHLHVWTQEHMVEPDQKHCMALEKVATIYRDVARPMYREAPEQMSSMLLVIAELWHSMDLLAVALVPLLKAFSPSISLGLFNPLLLPRRAQMQRLWEVELRVHVRHTQAKHGNPSIFSDPAERCFAVQYFASSGHLQGLKKRIEKDANQKRALKRKEWKRLNDEYYRLKEVAKQMSCQMTLNESGDEIHNSKLCRRCLLNQEADGLSIDVYEWPLPEDATLSKSAVFELDCPVSFAAWRNLTWMLLHDLGRQAPVGGQNPATSLFSYVGLKAHAKDSKSRLTLASSTRAFAQANYHLLNFPVTLDSCFEKNTLQYKLLDMIKGCWVKEQVETPSFHAACVTPLPDGPYSNLQYAVDSVGHSQNEVIANQELCDKALSLPEYLSFGSLRADGERIQWHNIKRELAASNLSLNAEAVCTLITQTALQAGSRGDSDLRNAHLDLQNPSFCVELLGTISKVLGSISASWKSDHAMMLLIVVVLRVLSLSVDTNVANDALDLLRSMRTVTKQWTSDLVKMIANCSEPDQISKLQQRLLKAAILCKMTFDVDIQYYSRMMGTADDLEIWVECSIHARNNSPGEDTLLPLNLRRLRLRDTKVSHALQNTIRELTINNISQGLDLAVAQQWTSFHPGPGPWRAFAQPNDRWLITETASTASQRPQQVCYNLLEGELLVNGEPIGRLPADYIRNDRYLRVFGSQILQVFPSDMCGMLYMSNQEFDGYSAHFGMREGQIIVRMRRGLQVLELIPHDQFVDDLPAAFSNDYVHWLDIATQEIELRPLKQPWLSSLDNWHLLYQPGSTSTLFRKDQRLIDIRSKTCDWIMEIFGALEAVEYIHVTFSAEQVLEVVLPRYDLRFFWNRDGEFQCYELGKVVDPDQSVGTLIGLKSRLVLSGITPLARKHDRILLIPEGLVSLGREGSHGEATITTTGLDVRIFRYQIDATLRRLQGSSDTLSTIYKAYLHAVTSGTLPDPLTGCTGTEEAISILRQRSLGLIEPPDKKIVDVLTRVAALTPRREFNPESLKVMQHVIWHKDLSMLAQHDEFLPLAEAILSSGDRYLVFYPQTATADSLLRRRDAHLLQRAKIRHSCFQNSAFGGRIDVSSHDSEYEARDLFTATARGSRSFEVASLVRDWPQGLEVSENLQKDLSSYGVISGVGTKSDATTSISELLDVPFSSSWAPLHELCRACSQENDTYRLIFLFAILAYGSKVFSLTTLRTLLAFAFVPEMRKVQVPTEFSYFEPRMGTSLDKDNLRSVIIGSMDVYRGPGKRKDPEHWNVKKDKYDALSKRQAEDVLAAYKRQWPCVEPRMPSKSLSTHLDWDKSSKAIADLFYTWTANRQYEGYFKEVQTILNKVNGNPLVLDYASTDCYLSQEPQSIRLSGPLPSISGLMTEFAPTLLSKPEVLKLVRTLDTTQENEKLRTLIAEIRFDHGANNYHLMRKEYRDDLLASYDSFVNYKEHMNPQGLPPSLTDTLLNRLTCESEVSEMLKAIYDVLSARDPISRLLEFGGLWPRLTIRPLLANLSTRSSTPLTQSWRKCLLMLGEALTVLQRARRLVLAGERDDISTFFGEIENEGHQGWNTEHWPDWLLIEIEGDFLIRPAQARVALEMIQPSSSENSLVQLNMGQ